MNELETSIIAFIVAIIIGYFVISGQSGNYSLAKWGTGNWVLMAIIAIVAIIGVSISSPTSTRKEYTDLEKENIRWSHEAYDYIHSGDAARDMGY